MPDTPVISKEQAMFELLGRQAFELYLLGSELRRVMEENKKLSNKKKGKDAV